MSNTTHHSKWASGLLLILAIVVPVAGVAREPRRESDDPGARAQAMREWYTDDYSKHGRKVRLRGQKKALWSPGYERFMHQAAKRERTRYRALLPGSGTSATMIDSTSSIKAASDTTWSNIGPTKANYLQNGVTLNVTDSGRVNAIVTDPANPNTLYVAFSGGADWKSTDGGAFWQAKTETLGSLSVGALEMDPNNASVLYLGLGDPFDGTGIGLVKSSNGANTWSDPVLLGNSSVIADIQVAPGNSNIVLVATNTGLYRSTNAGASFSNVALATGSAELPVLWSIAWGGGSNFVLSLEASPSAAITDGQIWRSTDDGASWVRATGITHAAGVDRISLDSAPSNRTVMYATAADGSGQLANIFKSIDDGLSWTGIGMTGAAYKAFTNPNAESRALSDLFNGQGWYNHMTLVDRSNPNIAYFGGALLMAKTSDGGSTFSQASNWLAQFGLPYVHADFHAGHIASNGTLYVGTDGGIFRSTNAGTTFTDTLNEGIASHLVYQVGSSTANRDAVVIGLQDNGTRVRVSNSSVFNQTIGGDGFGCDVNRSNANLMLGTVYFLDINKSANGGVDFNPACSGIAECGVSGSAPFITRLSRWAGDATGNTVYTFSNTKVYKTTNYAGSWSALGTSGLPASSLFLRNVGSAPGNASVVGVVANGGRVFLSSNGGANWAAPTGALPNNGFSLSWIAFDPTDSGTIYVASVAPDQVRNHLWRSSNAGSSWTAIDSSASGFPAGIPVNSVVVDPVTPATLYAATQLGVYRSTNSGSSWSRYGAGMPLVNVTDLYVANDDSLVRAATFGRSVWELGGGAVNAPPQANFTVSSNGLTVSFTDTSTDSDGTIASRNWAFGDGTTSTAINPVKTYAAAGIYTVALTVTDNQGGTNTRSQTITVTTAQTYVNGTDVAIPDNGSATSSILVSGRTGLTRSALVSVKVLHPSRGDLSVDLIASDGRVRRLQNPSGGSADNIDATYKITLLPGSPLNGTWSIRVSDGITGDVGNIDRWSITF